MVLGLGRVYENLVEKDIDFFLGQIEQVHLHSEDKPSGLKKDVSPQAIQVRPLDSAMPTTSRTVPAFPLLRGISDSVTRGDLVLITLIYEKYFYIGPINSFNEPNYGSNPTWTKRRKNLGVRDDDQEFDLPNGYGEGYPIQDVDKLIKNRSFDLDGYTDDLHHTSKHTDLVFEGRHGNAIRIGSRDKDPILNISNGNELGVESANYGSLISLIENGSIRQHHGRFHLSTDANRSNGVSPRYQITIGNGEKPFTKPNSSDLENLELNVYNYSQEIREETDKDEFHQILITSNNIILDARTNNGDLTLSSGKNINIGATQNFTLNNEGKSVINSNNIYLGERARYKNEPMVLGNELRLILLEIMGILQKSRALVQGVPIPFVDQNSKLMSSQIQKVISKLNKMAPEGDTGKKDGVNFLSTHHYIEQNDRSLDNEG